MESKTDPLKEQEHQHHHQLQHSATRRNALQHTAPWRAMSDGIQDHQHHSKKINIKIDIKINIQSNITKRDSKNNIINDTSQHNAAHYSTLQHTAIRCDTLQRTATHCTTLQPQEQQHRHQQHTATHCSTPQHTATHCNSLQIQKQQHLHHRHPQQFVYKHSVSSSQYVIEMPLANTSNVQHDAFIRARHAALYV